jgi:hypothetical protein
MPGIPLGVLGGAGPIGGGGGYQQSTSATSRSGDINVGPAAEYAGAGAGGGAGLRGFNNQFAPGGDISNPSDGINSPFAGLATPSYALIGVIGAVALAFLLMRRH